MQGAVAMRRQGGVLVPADDEAKAAVERVKDGDLVAVKVWRKRSLPQHRLLWAFLTQTVAACLEEQDVPAADTPEQLLVAVKVALGRYDLMKLPNGRVVPVPHSISFAEMPQDEFKRFFDEAVAAVDRDILRKLAPMTRDRILLLLDDPALAGWSVPRREPERMAA